MASNPAPTLPLLYKALEPISRQAHGEMKFRQQDGLEEMGTINALPLTVDEFGLAHRNYPIIFSNDDQMIPLALMGLHDGTNVFFDAKGLPHDKRTYIPAYVRRYPFMLAQLEQGNDTLSLCYDHTSGALDKKGDGEPVFEGEEASAMTKQVLDFCEQFEQAGQRTAAFVAELKEYDLMMEGEVAIQVDDSGQPFVYRGFRMVDEEKFRNLSGDKLRKMNKSGMLALIMAHLFSLSLVRDLFSRHIEQGTGPKPANGAPAEKADA